MRNTFEFVVTPKELATAARGNHERSARHTPSVRRTWVVLWVAFGIP